MKIVISACKNLPITDRGPLILLSKIPGTSDQSAEEDEEVAQGSVYPGSSYLGSGSAYGNPNPGSDEGLGLYTLTHLDTCVMSRCGTMGQGGRQRRD
uniref:Uncharacterized protein n=1 Tax=Knipowitschia caucasica TaxID=637954 RepID=A0AAV2KBG8_KNICA